MNEAGQKVEIFKPFGEAFDLTKKILFQPFNLEKWCLIGLTAFLAHLAGGFNFNFAPRGPFLGRRNSQFWDDLKNNFTPDQIPGWLIPVVLCVVLVGIAVAIVLVWVGSRGRFMFVDCIVHDRAAIVRPWNEYAREGNSLFLFSLVAALIVFGLVAIAALLGFLLMRGYEKGVPVGLILELLIFIPLLLVTLLFWTFSREFMVVTMYRQRCAALAAFRKVMTLISQHPGPIILFVLFSVALGMGVAMVSVAAMCVTCCLAALPYVGTVILLPVHVALQGYSLFFMRQFGPDFDAWTGVAELGPPLDPPSVPR